MTRLNRQSKLSRDTTNSTAGVAFAMCDSQVPISIWPPFGNGDQVIEAQILSPNNFAADMAYRTIPLDNECSTDSLNPIASQSRSAPATSCCREVGRSFRIVSAPLTQLCTLLQWVSPITASQIRSVPSRVTKTPCSAGGGSLLVSCLVIGAALTMVFCGVFEGIGAQLLGISLIVVTAGCVVPLSIRLMGNVPALVARWILPVWFRAVNTKGFKWLRRAALRAYLHFALLSRYSSTMRLTNSATGIPRQAASAFKKIICGSVKEIICLCIPQGYQKVCAMSRRGI